MFPAQNLSQSQCHCNHFCCYYLGVSRQCPFRSMKHKQTSFSLQVSQSVLFQAMSHFVKWKSLTPRSQLELSMFPVWECPWESLKGLSSYVDSPDRKNLLCFTSVDSIMKGVHIFYVQHNTECFTYLVLYCLILHYLIQDQIECVFPKHT